MDVGSGRGKVMGSAEADSDIDPEILNRLMGVTIEYEGFEVDGVVEGWAGNYQVTVRNNLVFLVAIHPDEESARAAAAAQAEQMA